MDKAFICSPYRGDVEENVRKAREYCRWAAMEHGVIPAVRLRNAARMHLLFPQFLDDSDPAQRELGIDMGLELLADCKRLYYFSDKITEGMAKEMNRAHALGIPTEYVPEEELSATESTEMGGIQYE